MSDDASRTQPAPRRSWPRRMLNRLEVDRAVFYALVLRGWQLVAGLVSVLLISWYFTERLQGFYYTFYGLLALQSFFELGLSIAVVSAASHEWSGLRLDADGRIAGDASAASRLVSLGRSLAGWYAGAALLFMVFVSIAGVAFFSQEPAEDIAWQRPWIALVLLSGGLLWTLPFGAILEGCHQVATVNRYRLVQAVLANVAIWAAIVAGAGLWAAVVSAAARLAVDLYLIAVRYRRFFQALLYPPAGPAFPWKEELLPMQWRLALNGLVSYFEFGLWAPVMFHYHGAEVAGQMGMSWTLFTAIQAAALAWVQARAPLLGTLVARRDYRELDRVYFRVTGVSTVMIGAASLTAWLLVFGLYAVEFRLAGRLLPPLPTAVFLLAITLCHVPRCQLIYLRAHKREPLLFYTVATSLLIGLLVWLLGAKFGPDGAACGYLSAIGLFALPLQTYRWSKLRADWHRE